MRSSPEVNPTLMIDFQKKFRNQNSNRVKNIAKALYNFSVTLLFCASRPKQNGPKTDKKYIEKDFKVYLEELWL